MPSFNNNFIYRSCLLALYYKKESTSSSNSKAESYRYIRHENVLHLLHLLGDYSPTLFLLLCFVIITSSSPPLSLSLDLKTLFISSPPPQVIFLPLLRAFPPPPPKTPTTSTSPPTIFRQRLPSLPLRRLLLLRLSLLRHRKRPRLVPLPPFHLHPLRIQTSSFSDLPLLLRHHSPLLLPFLLRRTLLPPILRPLRHLELSSRPHRNRRMQQLFLPLSSFLLRLR